MATLIKSVSFQNFYNYYGNFDKNKFEFKKGINIINADNNMGKSKFYNGFLWILKNIVYDSDLKRHVDASNSFIKMASGKAKNEESEFVMGVCIVILEEDIEYLITKTVKFNRQIDGWNNSKEILDIVETCDNKTIPIYDILQKDSIINKIIPLELLNYALLQGESMEKLVDLSSRDGLSSTIEALADISNLLKINSISKDMTKRAKDLLSRKEISFSENNEKVLSLTTEKTKLEEYIEQSFDKIEIYQEELSRARKKKDELEALQLNATDRERFRGIQERLLEEKRIKVGEKEKKELNITSKLFTGTTPWILLGLKEEINNFSTLRDALNIERAKQQITNDPTILLPEGSPDVLSLKRMLDDQICEVCGRNAKKHTDEWEHIKMIMNRPKKENNITRNNFTDFFSPIQNNISSFYNSILEIENEVAAYRDDINLLQNEIEQKEGEYEDAKMKFINAGGKQDLSDKRIISDYSLAEKNENDAERLIKDTKKLIDQWKLRLAKIDELLSDSSENNKVKDYRDFRDTMCIVESIFLNTKNRIYDEIIKSLEINANQKYSDLTVGNSTSGGNLCFIKQEDSTVQVSIKDKLNGEITGLGTGFQRMKQLSIVMAIISSKIGDKQFNYPFISDAPFSEFGANFINNFFQVAPKVFTQSIIMIKELYDPEVPDFLNPFGKRILKEMQENKIPGTFYVNVIEEKADTTNLVTINKCYKY